MRDYIDEVFFELARISEAMEVLDMAYRLAPFDSEPDRRDAANLLATGLDVQRHAIPKAQETLQEYFEHRATIRQRAREYAKEAVTE